MSKKKTRGRPQGIKFERSITMKLMDIEFEAFNGEAQRLGVSLSAWIRSQLRERYSQICKERGIKCPW